MIEEENRRLTCLMISDRRLSPLVVRDFMSMV
jgi:hypothetical protein